MKSRRGTTFILLAAVLAVAGLAMGAPQAPQIADPADARTASLDTRMPIDPNVRSGRFDNGLRYYIRANQEPENRAELRLVINTGSVLEDDDQLGMAHLVEHMAFNGTEHFEKHELIEFMESIGMRLGPDVNAYTSFDETVYMLQVPTDNEEYISTAFQILEDWTHAVTLDGDEIDAERGVVVEEWRLGQGAFARVNDKQFPIIFKDSRYAERLPIGTEESIQGSSHEAIRRFYDDWYRPDLMAVIAVGDFDVDEIEDMFRQHFEGLPAAESPRERVMFDVPDQPGTDFAIATDAELPNTTVGVYYKMDLDEEGTVGAYRQVLVESIYVTILNQRLQELTQSEDPPFAFGGSGKGAMVRTKGVYQVVAGVEPGGVARGLDAVLTETARVEQFGFTPTELERTKANMMRGMERAYDERANRRSSSFVSEYTRAFLSGEPIPGIEYEFEIYKRFVPEITLEEVNEVGRDWISDENRVVFLSAPASEDVAIPTEDDLLAVIDGFADKELTAYEDTVTDDPLVPVSPTPSPVVAERTYEAVGITEWELGNGVTVVLKPTDYKDDEIVFRATSPGGTSLASDEDYLIASTANAAVRIGGMGEFSRIDLQKKLAGKVARASASIGQFSEGMSGSASPKDIETLFELIYLAFTAPRADPVVFQAYLQQGRAALANQEATPQFAFGKRLTEIRWQDHPRRQTQTAADLEKWNLERSYAFFKDRFADASDFTFLFAGNFDLESIRPLIEQYLGGLPSINREETWRDVGIRHVQGVVVDEVHAGIEPQSQTRMYFTGPFEYERQNRTTIRAMALLLQTRLRNVMREDLGGTYGAGVGASYAWQPIDAYTVSISYGSDPERADELADVVFAEIEKLKEAAPEESAVADVRENFLRTFETQAQTNNYWLSQFTFKYARDEDPSDIATYPELVEALTPAMIQEAAQQYFNMGNYVRVTLLPEEQR